MHVLAYTKSKHTHTYTHEHMSHLDSVLDFTSVVSDDEGGLHNSRELDVAVSFMLTLELVQQGLIGRLGETGDTEISSDSGSQNTELMAHHKQATTARIHANYYSYIKLCLTLLQQSFSVLPRR